MLHLTSSRPATVGSPICSTIYRSAEVADIDIIEDVIPLYDLKISIKVPADAEVKTVTCVPEQQPLAFTVAEGRIEFTVPKLNGHQMVTLQY